MSNSNLTQAKQAKNDEFYTMFRDIEAECVNYTQGESKLVIQDGVELYRKDSIFKDKVVYCNCDNYLESEFFNFFAMRLHFWGIKKLIATHFNSEGKVVKAVFTPENMPKEIYNFESKEAILKCADITVLEGNGDFRSEECVEILKQADIVVTNPPFSLFREFVALMEEHNKKYLILGTVNAITYKEVFKLIKSNKLWLGVHANVTMEFKLANHYEKFSRVDEEGNKYGKVSAITWFTNLNHSKRNEEIMLYCKYNGNFATKYDKYDNYDAIEIPKTAYIPEDYEGVMGVPITFLTKYNPEQFEILGIANSARWIDYECFTIVDGVKIYNRILIKNRKPVKG